MITLAMWAAVIVALFTVPHYGLMLTIFTASAVFFLELLDRAGLYNGLSALTVIIVHLALMPVYVTILVNMNGGPTPEYDEQEEQSYPLEI